MLMKILIVVGVPVAWVALQHANAPLTRAEVLQYKAAYEQIINNERQRVEALQRQINEED